MTGLSSDNPGAKDPSPFIVIDSPRERVSDIRRETYRIGEAEVTQAEWQAARDQNQRLELLMDDMGSEENVAAVRAQLNGML